MCKLQQGGNYKKKREQQFKEQDITVMGKHELE